MPLSATCPMSGRYGAASFGSVLSTIRDWRVGISSDLKTFIASNTHGGTGRRAGIFDWQGSFNQYGGMPVALPGDSGTFIGYPGPGDGIIGSNGPCATGPAVISQLQTTWNWMTNEIIQTAYTMMGDGPLTNSVDVVTDASTPVTTKSSAAAAWAFTPVGGSLANYCIQQAVLTLMISQKEFANSCTGGWKGRKAGPCDWNLALTMDEADMTKLVGWVPGAFIAIKAYINATQFWDLKWGIIQDFVDYSVNIETGDIVSYTVNIAMATDDGNVTAGHIIAPDTTTYWPAA